MDLPRYVIKPDSTRILVPKIFMTALLGLLFYAGIVLNVYLLGFNVPGSVTLLILVILTLMIIIQNILTYLQISKTRYLVFDNRIQIEGMAQQYCMFNSVTNIAQKKTFFDTVFKTGTIIIEPGLKLAGIPNFDQTYAYINQIINYARSQFNQ